MTTRYKPTAEVRRLVDKIIESPDWELDGIDNNHHGVIRHIPTDQTVGYPLHTPHKNAIRSIAREVEAIDGRKLFEHNRCRPGRRKADTSGFNLAAAAADVARRREAEGTVVLEARQRQLIIELDLLFSKASRSDAIQARRALAELRKIEAQLALRHVPFTPWEPQA